MDRLPANWAGCWPDWSGAANWLRPDAKTQVSVLYENNAPVKVTDVLISTQHQPGLDAETLIKPDLIEHVIRPSLPAGTTTISMSW